MQAVIPSLITLIVILGAIPNIGYARETCGEMRRNLAFLTTELQSAEDAVQQEYSLYRKYQSALDRYQAERRQLACIGDRHYDRETTRRCRHLDKGYIDTLRFQEEVSRYIVAYGEQRDKLLRRLNHTRTRFKKYCTCWKPGVPNTGMSGRNIGSRTVVDADACKVACNKSLRCRSIDFNPSTGACYLNDLDSRSRGPTPSFTSLPNWPFTYYERCRAF